MNRVIVQTSINKPTKDMIEFSKVEGWDMVVVGDDKTPDKEYKDVDFTYISLADQKGMDLTLPSCSFVNHYARKNVGYLEAMQMGADILAETDDDNAPLKGWGKNINFLLESVNFVESSSNNLFNVYEYFYDKERYVWPRGFPLSKLDPYSPVVTNGGSKEYVKVGAWQQLIENDPDVDAIHRLIFNNTALTCRKTGGAEIVLGKNVFCPFNSQNTFWCKETFPLLYLPITVSPRYTDILRGYVAQRVFWEHGYNLGFSGSTVVQERNEHDLMKDFKDEVSMYTTIDAVIDGLINIDLEGSRMTESLRRIYNHLFLINVVSIEELDFLDCWIDDVKTLQGESV